MPSWNDYKTTNPAYFPIVSGIPSWKLSIPANPWDSLMDGIANLHADINGNTKNISNLGAVASATITVGGMALFGGVVSQVHTGIDQNFCVRTNIGGLELAVINDAGSGFTTLRLNASNYVLVQLPSANPGAGTKQLWYDPADSNRIKFAA